MLELLSSSGVSLRESSNNVFALTWEGSLVSSHTPIPASLVGENGERTLDEINAQGNRNGLKLKSGILRCSFSPE